MAALGKTADSSGDREVLAQRMIVEVPDIRVAAERFAGGGQQIGGQLVGRAGRALLLVV